MTSKKTPTPRMKLAELFVDSIPKSLFVEEADRMMREVMITWLRDTLYADEPRKLLREMFVAELRERVVTEARKILNAKETTDRLEKIAHAGAMFVRVLVDGPFEDLLTSVDAYSKKDSNRPAPAPQPKGKAKDGILIAEDGSPILNKNGKPRKQPGPPKGFRAGVPKDRIKATRKRRSTRSAKRSSKKP